MNSSVHFFFFFMFFFLECTSSGGGRNAHPTLGLSSLSNCPLPFSACCHLFPFFFVLFFSQDGRWFIFHGEHKASTVWVYSRIQRAPFTRTLRRRGQECLKSRKQATRSSACIITVLWCVGKDPPSVPELGGTRNGCSLDPEGKPAI